MRHYDTEHCKIAATLYAAWNDLLIDAKEPTDDAILHEVLNNWHEEKKRIPKDRWLSVLQWIREKGLIPTGFGKKTKVKPTQDNT
ncbi:MAG: hypothetical protein H7843_09565 [Nitrospirota bacterium]